MNYYPIYLDLRGKKALVVGGGVVAARKVEGLLECGARVTVISPLLHPDLLTLQTQFEWIAKEYGEEPLSPYFLVITATNDRELNDRIWKRASDEGKLVNVVDVREQCNFIAPGVARCGDLALSVSTGGVAPFLTRHLAEQLRREYGDSFKKYLDLMKQARIEVKQSVSDPEKRNQIFAQLCSPEILERARRGDELWVSKTVKSILDSIPRGFAPLNNKKPPAKPLSGKTLVVTRALAQAGTLSERLKNLGAEVIEYPCIEIEVLPGLSKKIRSLGDFSKFTDLIFTSVNGVNVFFQALGETGKKPAVLKGQNILSIGPKTNEALKGYGVHGSMIPKHFQAEGILELLPADLRGRCFLLPRARNARELLPDEIKKRGGKIMDFPLYESVPPKNPPSLDRPKDGICFTSVSTVLNFAKQSPIRAKDVAFVIGNITAQSATSAGFKKVFMAREATIESLVESIQKKLTPSCMAMKKALRDP